MLKRTRWGVFRLEAEASLDVDEVHVIAAEEQGRGAHFVRRPRRELDLRGRLVDQTGPERAHVVREGRVGERERVAAVAPDVVLGGSLQGELVGDLPAWAHEAALYQHEAGVDVFGRPDVALHRGDDGELAGWRPSPGGVIGRTLVVA